MSTEPDHLEVTANKLTIIFGVLATIIAVAAIILGFWQYRIRVRRFIDPQSGDIEMQSEVFKVDSASPRPTVLDAQPDLEADPLRSIESQANIPRRPTVPETARCREIGSGNWAMTNNDHHQSDRHSNV